MLWTCCCPHHSSTQHACVYVDTYMQVLQAPGAMLQAAQLQWLSGAAWPWHVCLVAMVHGLQLATLVQHICGCVVSLVPCLSLSAPADQHRCLSPEVRSSCQHSVPARHGLSLAAHRLVQYCCCLVMDAAWLHGLAVYRQPGCTCLSGASSCQLSECMLGSVSMHGAVRRRQRQSALHACTYLQRCWGDVVTLLHGRLSSVVGFEVLYTATSAIRLVW